jgi:hypothetical protein
MLLSLYSAVDSVSMIGLLYDLSGSALAGQPLRSPFAAAS